MKELYKNDRSQIEPITFLDNYDILKYRENNNFCYVLNRWQIQKRIILQAKK